MSYLTKLLSKLESIKAVQKASSIQHQEEIDTAATITTTTTPESPIIIDDNVNTVTKDDRINDNGSGSSRSAENSTMCEMCTKAASKYTCPGCGVKTCSLQCVKDHKARLSCSGERIKTEFVDKSLYSDRHLLNDYRFLENAERSVYSNKMVPKNRHMGGFHHNYRQSPYHHHHHHHHHHQQTQHSKRATILMGAAKKRGIHLRMMPDHLEKHKTNTSFYTISTDVIDWHIEWQFVSTNSLVKDEKVPEKAVLMETVKKFGNAMDYPHLRKPLEDYRKKFHLSRYLIKVEGLPANRKRYIELYPSLTIGENLKGLTLVEHPTIFVLPPSYSCGDDFQILDKDKDLSHMHQGTMRHLTRNHPEYSQEEIVQDQILDPASSLYKPAKNSDGDGESGEEDDGSDGDS